jgi:hypothetical protein
LEKLAVAVLFSICRLSGTQRFSIVISSALAVFCPSNIPYGEQSYQSRQFHRTLPYRDILCPCSILSIKYSLWRTELSK